MARSWRCSAHLGAPNGAGGEDALAGEHVEALYLEAVGRLLRLLRGAAAQELASSLARFLPGPLKGPRDSARHAVSSMPRPEKQVGVLNASALGLLPAPSTIGNAIVVHGGTLRKVHCDAAAI